MAWQEVETDIGAKVGTVKYSVALKHGGARISVPAPIALKLGWTVATTYKLMVGGGESSGMLRLEPVPNGKIRGRTPPKGGDALTIRLGRWPGLAPRNVDAVSVEPKIEGAVLMVTLPQYARNEPPPPRVGSSATPVASVTVARPGAAVPAKRDVTGPLMGDPKRSVEMVSGTRRS